ncbi:MAG TPA: hypothetical protein GX728_03305 [Clostridiaceae bacterium]|nr:hypothetical protein [Clostridiaceae bacterium]
MKTNRFRLKSRTIRQILPVLIATSLFLTIVFVASCDQAGSLNPDGSESPASESMPMTSPTSELTTTTTEPATITTTFTTKNDAVTEPPLPVTTTPADELWEQDLSELMNALRPPIVPGNSIPFDARILRTPPRECTVGISTNPVIISNVDQLTVHLSKAQNGWYFNDTDVDNLLDVYNREFFRKNVLIAGAVGLNSGSIQVDIKDVIQTDEHLTVLFNFTFPELGTCDMMSWYYFVEVSANDAAGRTAANSYLPNVESPTLAY